MYSIANFVWRVVDYELLFPCPKLEGISDRRNGRHAGICNRCGKLGMGISNGFAKYAIHLFSKDERATDQDEAITLADIYNRLTSVF